MNRKLIVVAVVLVALTACQGNREAARKGGKTVQQEQTAVQTGFNRLSNSQPVPQFDWSQERQTLIDVEGIRSGGAKTTTSGYLEGIGLIWWCPSIGSPVPSTYQLSGSKQYVDLPDDRSRERFEVDQGEPTGVYVGPSSGTWTICLDDNGKKFGQYWEGYVSSTTGVVGNLPADKRVRVNEVTYAFTEKPR